MAPERWPLISRLYHDAMARQRDARPAFLRDACTGDAALRREVEWLVAQAASVESAPRPIDRGWSCPHAR